MRKPTVSFVMCVLSVPLCAHIEQLGSHYTDFHPLFTNWTFTQSYSCCITSHFIRQSLSSFIRNTPVRNVNHFLEIILLAFVFLILFLDDWRNSENLSMEIWRHSWWPWVSWFWRSEKFHDNLGWIFSWMGVDGWTDINLSNPTVHVMHQQFNIQQLYVLPTLYLCVLYLSENKQRLVPLTA